MILYIELNWCHFFAQIQIKTWSSIMPTIRLGRINSLQALSIPFLSLTTLHWKPIDAGVIWHECRYVSQVGQLRELRDTSRIPPWMKPSPLNFEGKATTSRKLRLFECTFNHRASKARAAEKNLNNYDHTKIDDKISNELNYKFVFSAVAPWNFASCQVIFHSSFSTVKS